MSASPSASITDSLIADSAARLFAQQVDPAVRQRAEGGGFDAALWERVTDSGFAHMLAAETAGGLGQNWLAAFAVLRGIGYWQVPLPLAETMVAALLASAAGIEVAHGPLTLIEQGQGNHLEVAGSDSAPALSGVAHAVPWARHARAALVSLTDGRLAWLELRANPGVSVQEHLNPAGLPSDTLVVRDARCTDAKAGPFGLREPVWLLGAVARSAMLVGALESALELAVRHAGERVQFGKPIGKYQAIQHSLALFAGDVAAARVAALVAAADAPDAATAQPGAAADRGWRNTAFSTAVAKVRTSEAATRGSAIAHQVHGAIGFTQEHPLHFATRRLWAWRAEFGSDAYWAAVLGRAAIKARAGAFWPSLTDKHFA